MRAIVVFCALSAAVQAQSLRVPPSPNGRAETSFPIVLESPAGKAPVALQWELSVPPAITVAREGIQPGDAAKPDKQLICTAKNGPAGSGARYACILAGGTKPIPNGAIAIVRYSFPRDLGGVPIRILIQKVLGVSADAQRLEMPDAQAIVRSR